ncbi:cytochrome aa3 quinol oxidase subunit II [Pontibacillus yanchengensis]|uniref:Quinol oxidase subunit 2 n=1 Tax=Pontibacillus yanchengensis Y32 TaxID=1385514 RepID=A0A0A2TD23_9BACI|nr:cytochrome aa3 quinol oxidase subunit II [Pontibacillus yanchengensis]KGP72308.1 quinol oxidase subunit 2 [Pontibacillus yanchengensis Y32]
MKQIKHLLLFSSLLIFLSGCSALPVLDPKGPVADAQKDLIVWSISLMLIVVAVVFGLFAFIITKYRERPGHDSHEPDEMEGNKWLEIIWTVIPIIIVILLAVPTVKTIYELEEAPESSKDKEPLIIHATSANWKWFFSYPEQEIETVNYLHIPEDRPILFKLSSADSMAALWIPRLGGQEYNMAGMLTEIYLQADEPGVYQGRNANFTGEGFTKQQFKVYAESPEKFQNWVNKTQNEAPALTQNKYDELLLPGHVPRQTYSSTHLQWVNHAKNAEYAIKARERQGYNPEEAESH